MKAQHVVIFYLSRFLSIPLRVFKMKNLVSHKKLQHYKKHYGSTCVTGVFGCRWHRYQQSKKDTRKVDVAWYAWLLLCCAFVIFVLYYWILAGNDYDDFGWYLYDNTGYLWPLYTIMLSLTSILTVYVALLFVLSLCHVGLGHEMYMHWVHRVFTIACTVCAIIVLIALTDVYSKGWALQRISLMITGPFLHLSVVILMTSLSWFIAGYWYSIRIRYVKVAYMCVFCIVMLNIYISPVFIDSPCVCLKSDLPDPPYIYTHRGASAIVPENTLEAFKEAAKYSHVEAFESDVTVSADGVPFLMHDRTLIRTTDVEDKFPSRKDDCACSFNISEIRELDAGKWFLETNPHNTLSQLSSGKKESFKHLKIPRLDEFLEIMKKYNKKFLFDIQTYEYGIPESHPHYHDYGDVIIKTIQDSGVNQQDVLWLYDKALNTTVPHQFTIITGKLESEQELLSMRDASFNLPYETATYDDVKVYHDHNVTVNVWVVNSAWLYSLYWCMGVHSVTTNFAQKFSNMHAPVWHLTPTEFEALWVVVDFISAVIILIVFIVQKIRSGRTQTFRQELSIQNARQHISQKQQHRKHMREKLIRSAEGIHHRENSALDLAENGSLDQNDTQSIDSSISVDIANISDQMVKLENIARERNSDKRKNHGKEIDGMLEGNHSPRGDSNQEVETSLEDITVHEHVNGADTAQKIDNFEHELPTNSNA